MVENNKSEDQNIEFRTTPSIIFLIFAVVWIYSIIQRIEDPDYPRVDLIIFTSLSATGSVFLLIIFWLTVVGKHKIVNDKFQVVCLLRTYVIPLSNIEKVERKSAFSIIWSRKYLNHFAFTLTFWNTILIKLKEPQTFSTPLIHHPSSYYIVINVRNPNYFIQVMNEKLSPYRFEQKNEISQEENNKLPSHNDIKIMKRRHSYGGDR